MKLSLADWLRTRKPPAPGNLLERMLAEIEQLDLAESDVSPKALANAGDSILKALYDNGCADRGSALDLLAADALFTYAFEAAADSKAEMDETSRYVLEKVTTS